MKRKIRILLAVVACQAMLAAPAHAGEAAGPALPDIETLAGVARGDPVQIWNLADFHRKRLGEGDAERSIDLFRLALARIQATDGAVSKNAAIVFGNIAGVQSSLGRNEEAQASRRSQIAILEQVEPRSTDHGYALQALAVSLQASSRFADAEPIVDQAHDILAAGFGEQSVELAYMLYVEGANEEGLKRHERAAERYRQSALLYERAGAGSDGDAAIMYGNVAGQLTQIGRHADAQAALRSQIAILERIDPQSSKVGLVLEDLALSLQRSSRFDEAEPLVERARRILLAQHGDESFEVAYTFFLEAANAEGLRRHEQAVEVFREAARRYQKVEGPDSENAAYMLSAVARNSSTLARYADAEVASKRQVEILRKIAPRGVGMANGLQELAITYQKLARNADSLPLLAEARSIFIETSGDMSLEVGDTYLNEGTGLEGLKRYPEAIAAHEQAALRYAAAGGKDHVFVGYAINNIAWVYRRMERYADADREFRRALPLLEKNLGPTHANTTKVYINIGIMAQLLGNNDEAIRWTMRALSNINATPTATLDDQRWAYNTMAKAFKGRGDARRAILFAKLAINAQQKIRSQNKSFTPDQLTEFKAEWRFLYQDLADLLIGEGRLGEAQSVLDMEKDEELADFVQRDASADLRDVQAAMTPREDGERARLRGMLTKPIAAAAAVTRLVERRTSSGLTADEEAQVAALEASLDKAYAGFMDDVDAFLASADAETMDVRREVDAINLDYTADAQEELRTLGGKAAMLQIASLSQATHIFLTVADASVHREVKIPREQLSAMVFDALTAIERRDPDVNRKLQALQKVLIAPVVPDLEESGVDTLMLNLQGFLRYVPFAALHDGSRYLVEDYALSLYTPAAKTRFEAAPRAPDKSVGFGVTSAHPGFAPLPGVAQELRAIFGAPERPGALRGAARMDADFTRDSFSAALKTRPEIIHIASHFKLVPGREDDSFLLLGDGSPLTLSDIRKGRGFRFGGVDLLTLSACETARGGDSDGEEVESFGALAQMNGASSVMATLWPVADDATARIMQSFYRRMMEGGVTKAEALRLAQIEAVRGPEAAAAAAERGAVALASARQAAAVPAASHPYFWSPFVLMGNWL